MFLDDFEKYSSQYEGGIKRISFRSMVPKIEKKSYTLELARAHGNYELFFNDNGALTHSVHHDGPYKFTMVFGYRYGNKLIVASKLNTKDQQLLELTQYYYDKSERIQKEINWNFYEGFRWNNNDRALHTYTEDSHITFHPKSKIFKNDATFITKYDRLGKMIEEKAFREPDDIFWWDRYEYSSDGELLRQISLDENGIEDGVYDYFGCERGLTAGYRYKSDKLNYLREYQYTYNERGHWTTKVSLRDGQPQHFYEREIVYQRKT
jgi:hypothetical protein